MQHFPSPKNSITQGFGLVDDILQILYKEKIIFLVHAVCKA